MRIYTCILLTLIGIKNKTYNMRLKTYILTIVLFIVSGHLFGQVDRKNAKFMDTCSISIINSEVILNQNPIDSTNQFIVRCNCELPKYRLSMFDRWGTVVLSSNDINDKLEFSNMKKGFYVWVVEVKYPNGKKDSKKGTIKIE